MHSIAHRRLAATLLVAVMAFCLLAPPAAACPTCSQALAEEGGGDLVAGFFWSILFMMSMPFLLLGSFALYCYWQIRKARLATQAAES